MDVKAALKDQYHGGLAMLKQCVDRCPDDLWNAPSPPDGSGWQRPFWRIAFHCAYFTQLYLGKDQDALEPPPADMAAQWCNGFEVLWGEIRELEPYDLPASILPLTQSELGAYVTYVDGLIDSTIDALDLDSAESGFPWYPKHNKLSHELMNLRHLQGHVGQLSELLMLRGIDTDWFSGKPRP